MNFSNLHSIKDYIRKTVTLFNSHNLFYGHGTDNSFDEARLLILGYLNLPWDISNQYLDCFLSDDEKETLTKLIHARIEKQIPVAYLIKKSYYCDLLFYIDERVLIPRSPISELIQNKFSPWLLNNPKRILDLCCGSGCIGIASAHAFPNAEVVLSDISFDALEVANINIEEHCLDDRVLTVQSNIFDNLQYQKFDLIISNPPYVDEIDFNDMPIEYSHEPENALYCGNDGLDLIRNILAEALDYLTDDGLLIIEVGNSYTHILSTYPEIEFNWINFKNGGHGVFILTANECDQYKKIFQSKIID